MLAPSPADVSRIVGQSFGDSAELESMTRIDPWQVARCSVRIGHHRRTVIIKWQRDGDPSEPDARAAPSQLLTEARALEFLDDVGLGCGEPRLVAIDTELPLLVMSEIVGRPLDSVIRSDGYGPHTRSLLVEFAEALARQHALTVGRADEFYARCRHLDPKAERRRILRVDGDGLEAVIGSMGGPSLNDEARRQQAEADRHLDQPGEFLALSNGDAATNNVLVGETTTLIDYEFAGYRHCLWDVAGFYLPEPGWLSAPEPVDDGIEPAYRQELARTIPAIADDRRFDAGLTAVAFAWARIRLGNLTTIDARPTRDPSRLQRLVTVEKAAELSRARGQFTTLGQWYGAVGQWLRRRWPDADVDWTTMEPYRSRG